MTNYSDAKYGMIPSGGITQADMWGLLNDITTSTYNLWIYKIWFIRPR